MTDAYFPFCGFIADRSGTITGLTEPLSSVLGYSGSELVGKYDVTLLLDSGEVSERAQDLSRLFGRKVSRPESLIAVAALDGKEIRNWTLCGRGGSKVSARLHVVATRPQGSESEDFLIYVERAGDVEDGESSDAFLLPDERPYQLLLQTMRHVYDPVNTMMTYASLLKQDFSGAAMTGYLNQILDEGRRLLQFLARSSELTQMLSGIFPVEIQPVSVADCLSETITDWCCSEQAGGFRLKWNLDPESGAWVMTDKHRFCRLVQALIMLSSEKTLSGVVSIQVRIVPDQHDVSLGNLKLDVFDTGVPMTEHYCFSDRKMHYRYVQVCAESIGGSVKWSLPSDFRNTGLRCSVSIPSVELIGFPKDSGETADAESRREVAGD